MIDGGSVHVGTNFEADESFETWSFHNTTGKIEVDASSLRDTTGAPVPAAADPAAVQ